MNNLKRYTIIGIIFVVIFGTLSHFIYEWSGNNVFLGFFFPVSESTWEHMKLCFFPMLLYSFYMRRKLRTDYPHITSSLLLGTMAGTALVPVLFYTYSGILGYHLLALDIGVFLASVLAAFAVVYRSALSGRQMQSVWLLKWSVFFLAACFFLFTYLPPDMGLFTHRV